MGHPLPSVAGPRRAADDSLPSRSDPPPSASAPLRAADDLLPSPDRSGTSLDDSWMTRGHPRTARSLERMTHSALEAVLGPSGRENGLDSRRQRSSSLESGWSSWVRWRIEVRYQYLATCRVGLDPPVLRMCHYKVGLDPPYKLLIYKTIHSKRSSLPRVWQGDSGRRLRKRSPLRSIRRSFQGLLHQVWRL